ncbi:MAG: WD40/YVTN/BNR-like repeat-containing protein [Pyrinomonadaceae bacterium]
MKRLVYVFTLATLLAGVAVFFGSEDVRAKITDYFSGDPDAPPWAGADFDEANYLMRRDQFVALLRGIDPERPADPTARSRAIGQADKQRQRIITAVEQANTPAQKLNATSIRSGSAVVNAGLADERSLAPLLNPIWVELGPNPIPLGQTSGGRTNVSGRTTAIEIDPTNPSTVYVGTAQGGLYRSLDGGTTWTPMMDSALTLAIGSLTLDTAVSPNRLWIGTGEANGSADSFAGVGIYRIDNPAGTPTIVGPFNPTRNYLDASSNPQSTLAFNGRSVSKILVSPTNHDTLLAGAAGGVIGLGGNPPFGNTIPPLAMRGLYRLDNVGGSPAAASVTRVAVSTTNTGQGLCLDNPCTVNRNVNDMVFDPSDATGNTLIVWLNGINITGDGGVYRSTNAMTGSPTFTQTFTTTATSTSNGRGQFVVAPQNPNPARIYFASGEASTLGSNCNSAANVGGLRRSDDGGQTWSAT